MLRYVNGHNKEIMAKLIVKEKYLKSAVAFGRNNSSYLLPLNEATQEQLKVLFEMRNKDTGDREFAYLFEDTEKKPEKPEVKK